MVQLFYSPHFWLNRNSFKMLIDRGLENFFVKENTPCLNLRRNLWHKNNKNRR